MTTQDLSTANYWSQEYPVKDMTAYWERVAKENQERRENPVEEKSILDDPQYPQAWDAYIGQDKAKRQLRLAAASAKARGVSMPHVLLACGEGGVGKTALAGLIAREMGTSVKVISGTTSADQMRKLLTSMSDGDVLFYDEIHQAISSGRAKAEWLLHYLQDGVLMGPMGPMEVPKVTIIGATTELGKLQKTIVGRFIVPPLSGYDVVEAAQIAAQMAQVVVPEAGLPVPADAIFVKVAEAGNCNPRAMRQILNTMRDIAVLDGVTGAEAYDISEALDMMEITPDGLTLSARRYLVVLHDNFEGAAGEKALASVMQEPGGFEEVERVLQNKGLIKMTKQGRQLSDAGVRRAQSIKRGVQYGFAS